MTSPPPNPPPSRQSSDHNPNSAVPSQRSQHQAWGAAAQQQGIRRGLTPISTSFAGSLPLGAPSLTQSPGPRQNPLSPLASSAFPALGAPPSSRQPARSSSISSNNSSFSPPPGQPQQQNHSNLLPSSSGRSRTIASTSHSQLASAAAASHGGGGGLGGNSSSGGSSKNFRASPSLSQSSFGSPTSSANPAAQSGGQAGQLSKIVVAQIFLLLSTMKEDKDRTKWDSQADQIRKLVDSNPPEVFVKYFRRLLVINAPQIWGSGRGSGDNHPLLVTEIQKIAQDPAQAHNMVEAIEFGEGDIFKDFDLSTFMEHFKMSPLIKVILASAFRKASKPDLRTKADAIISSNLTNCFQSIANAQSATGDHAEDPSAAIFAALVDHLAQDPPRNWNSDMQTILLQAFQHRYQTIHIPLEISSTMYLFNLLEESNTLVHRIQRNGAKCTENLEACKSFLETVELREISYQQVASAILFMAIAKDSPAYDSSIFISALREHRGGQRLDWQDVVHGFDREGLLITKSEFMKLFKALLPLASEHENFDIQLMWGGEWRYDQTQLTFASAFLSFSEDELDAAKIPRLRKAFTLQDFQDASDEVKEHAEKAMHHPLVSADATKALFNMVFRNSNTYNYAQGAGVIDNAINQRMDLFVCSVSSVPKPWGPLQDQAVKQLVDPFIFMTTGHHDFVLHHLWKKDPTWLAGRMQWLYQRDATCLSKIFEHARDHGWLNELIAQNNELSLDLAALAHSHDLFDLGAWLEQLGSGMPREQLLSALSRFLRNKAEDDLSTRSDPGAAATVPLAIKTVSTLLGFLGNGGLPEDERTNLSRLCIQAYPRLINYGEGFDSVIEANSRNGNALPAAADAQMQEHYKLMYSSDSQVREIIEVLQKYKVSQDSEEQDLFACMIYGLFDEYNCFGEYPLDALATTAVLFGGIINYNLLSRIALQVALSMVLEAVRDFPPSESMYKFGLQALIQFQDRLSEWKKLTEHLFNVPGLQGTQVYPTLERIVHDEQDAEDGEIAEQDMVNGAADDFLVPKSKYPDFTCIDADPPLRPDFYEEPDEQVQENVLFILNNVSERNLEGKTTDLKSKLREEHHQWFANYLVESRIKPQPNFQQLYMDLLTVFNDRLLWSEVLRETFVSIIRMLNAESTMNSSNERSHLKNLGAWLGAMTLAKNQAIKFRNISFKDLLIEAHDTQRLPVAIPFTCKVLSTAAESVVFRPPCAWTTELLRILVELYHFADLKLNLKFEIEVLCNALDIDHKDVEPSNTIRSRPAQEEEIPPTTVPDGLEGFSDLSLMSLNRARGTADRFSPRSILPELQDLASSLKHNYSLPPSNAAIQSRVRQILVEAAERAVSEIIGPVVERSVTIAAISASQLVAKDYALERDAQKYQDAAYNIVRSLAGSLAGVTCKEPLRASMTAQIQQMRQDLPEQALPQGSILMFVNDNLDGVCRIVEKAAEGASAPEIDHQIRDAVETRKNHTYEEPSMSRWSHYVPEPFKPSPGGLNREQLTIYEDFGKMQRGPPSHVNALSQDSSRQQLPDVLQQDPFAAVGSLTTPSGVSEPPTLARPHQQHQGPNLAVQGTPSLVNGYVDNQHLNERIPEFVANFHQAAQEAADEDPDRHLSESAVVQDWWTRLLSHLASLAPLERDHTTVMASAEMFKLLYADHQKPAIVELFAQVIRKLCTLSEAMVQTITTWCSNLNESQIFNATVTGALIKSELLDVRRVDMLTAKSLAQRRPEAVLFLRDLVGNVLLTDPPAALRADFGSSLAALAELMAQDPEISGGEDISRQLQQAGAQVEFSVEATHSGKAAQSEYIFDEWIRLQYQESTEQTLASFVQQLHIRNVLENEEDSAIFFMTSISAAAAAFELEEERPDASLDDAYTKIDALAKLLVTVVAHQAKTNGTNKNDKVAYFENLLSLIVMILSQHYLKRAELFNQKVFFRLFSTILSEINSSSALHGAMQEMGQALGRCLLMLQPKVFPAFSFAWLALISHRLFMPALLYQQDPDGWDLYCDLLERLGSYLKEQVAPVNIPVAAKDYFRGCLKVYLIIHHDFPEFLAENHFRLLLSIPAQCTQLRGLVVSAAPSSVTDIPDAFTDGLKVDRLDDIRRAPTVRGDLEKPLRDAQIKGIVDDMLTSPGLNEDALQRLVRGVSRPSHAAPGQLMSDAVLLNALVLYTVKHAESAARPRQLTFSAGTPHARMIEALLDKLPVEPRYTLISAMVNQLRWPNSHTQYFAYAIFHFFRAGHTDKTSVDIQEQITRILLERLIVHRPHPWGLIVTTLEFLKNGTYRFWNLPFVKAAPELERMFQSLFQQMAQGARGM